MKNGWFGVPTSSIMVIASIFHVSAAAAVAAKKPPGPTNNDFFCRQKDSLCTAQNLIMNTPFSLFRSETDRPKPLPSLVQSKSNSGNPMLSLASAQRLITLTDSSLLKKFYRCHPNLRIGTAFVLRTVFPRTLASPSLPPLRRLFFHQLVSRTHFH